jgi:diguanylate cyclase (GGDEF)-like protein
MHDESYDVTSLEPQSRPAAQVLLILADTPQPLSATAPAATNGIYTENTSDAQPEAVPDFPLGTVADLSAEVAAGDTNLPPAMAAHDNGSASSAIAHPLYTLLMPTGHRVTWSTRHDWAYDISATRNENKFDVIIVEADAGGRSTDKRADGAVEVCRELRRSVIGRYASILAVVPAGRKGDKARKTIDALIDAGADDFFAANATVAEVESRVRVTAQLSRLRAELAGARDQLRLQLQTDDLTKLLNRRFFFQNAHREVGRARRYNSELSCLMVEIDHYKRLCTTFGYESGDTMLRALAQILRDCTRDSDIVARFGDEKFVALLPETDINGATMLREKIQAATMQAMLTSHGQPLPMSVSIGEANRINDIAFLEDIDTSQLADDTEGGEHSDGTPLSTREELAELLKAADAALYVAKRGVRLPSFFSESPRRLPANLDAVDELPSLRDDF